MLDKTEYSRLVIKRTTETGSVPTIPPLSAITLNQFTPTDIMVGEFFENTVDDKLWLRTENSILPIQLGELSGLTGNFEIVSGQTWTDLHSLSGATNITIDWNNSNVQQLTLTGSTNIFFINGNAGGNYKLIVEQAVSGSYSITWNTIDTEWTNSVSPVMSSGSSVYDVYEFVYNGETYFGSYNQNYAAAPTPGIITADLYSYFDASNPTSLSGVSDTTWVSISGSNPSTATLYSGATYVGDLGGGVYFNSISAYTQSSSDILSNSGFTYEVWVRQMSASTEGSNTRIYGSETSAFEFFVNGLQLGYYTVGTGNVNLGNYNAINGVYLLTITYDETELKFYKNGVLFYTNPSITFVPNGNYSLFGTNELLTSFFGGIMYKVRTYSRALTTGEVINNWNVERTSYGY
jgi:hypothetical protein